MKLSQTTPLSLRPPAEQREQIERIAAELRKSPTQVVGDFIADCLQMLSSEKYGVPESVHMIQVLREARAASERRDKKEAAFWQDMQAGRTTGVCSDNPPETITIPNSFPHRVDFAVRICGNSMEPMIHEGEIGAFRRAEVAQDGRIVAAFVDGQMMLKVFKAANGGPAQLLSLNPAYPPIKCTADTRIQGIYEGKLRAEDIPELAKKSPRTPQVQGPTKRKVRFAKEEHEAKV